MFILILLLLVVSIIMNSLFSSRPGSIKNYTSEFTMLLQSGANGIRFSYTNPSSFGPVGATYQSNLLYIAECPITGCGDTTSLVELPRSTIIQSLLDPVNSIQLDAGVLPGNTFTTITGSIIFPAGTPFVVGKTYKIGVAIMNNIPDPAGTDKIPNSYSKFMFSTFTYNTNTTVIPTFTYVFRYKGSTASTIVYQSLPDVLFRANTIALGTPQWDTSLKSAYSVLQNNNITTANFISICLDGSFIAYTSVSGSINDNTNSNYYTYCIGTYDDIARTKNINYTLTYYNTPSSALTSTGPDVLMGSTQSAFSTVSTPSYYTNEVYITWLKQAILVEVLSGRNPGAINLWKDGGYRSYTNTCTVSACGTERSMFAISDNYVFNINYISIPEFTYVFAKVPHTNSIQVYSEPANSLFPDPTISGGFPGFGTESRTPSSPLITGKGSFTAETTSSPLIVSSSGTPGAPISPSTLFKQRPAIYIGTTLSTDALKTAYLKLTNNNITNATFICILPDGSFIAYTSVGSYVRTTFNSRFLENDKPITSDALGYTYGIGTYETNDKTKNKTYNVYPTFTYPINYPPLTNNPPGTLYYPGERALDTSSALRYQDNEIYKEWVKIAVFIELMSTRFPKSIAVGPDGWYKSFYPDCGTTTCNTKGPSDIYYTFKIN